MLITVLARNNLYKIIIKYLLFRSFEIIGRFYAAYDINRWTDMRNNVIYLFEGGAGQGNGSLPGDFAAKKNA